MTDPALASTMTTTPQSTDDVKTMEQTERRVDLDAIGLYGNTQEFPSVAGAHLEGAETGSDDPVGER